MKNECVAILDIRSSEIFFLLGAKGVNGTFVFSGMQGEKYDGYRSEGFFDENSVRCAAVRAISSVQQTYEGKIGKIYVGVPSSFISVITKGHAVSYHSKRKISKADVDALFESGLNELLGNGRCIRRSAMYFTLGDNRKYFSEEKLGGVPTTMLKGALSYYFVSESFYALITGILGEMGFADIQFIPSTLAQASYLLPEKKREGYAFLLDVGFVTSSISVIYGNGIVREENCDCGVASVLVALMDELNIDFAEAEELLSLVNISGGSEPMDMEYRIKGWEKVFSAKTVNDIIKCELDRLCVQVEEFLRKDFREKMPMLASANPISITGEGVTYIKGATEYIAKTVNWMTEVVAPDLPYYDKPVWSSRITLLSAALSDAGKRSWLRKIFNFGGKKK